MARSPTEAEADFQERIATFDPSADTTKGPIFDWVVRPGASVIAEVEERQDRTDRLLSGDFAAATTPEELELMAATVGAGIPVGQAATHIQVFGTHSRPKPGQIIPIPAGTLVGTQDGLLVYQTTEAASIDGDFPRVHLNPARRSYEVRVPIRAVAAGSKYNLPPLRIRRVLSTLNGIDFTENRTALDDGVDPGGTEDLVVRGQTQFAGQELGTQGGLENAIVKAFQERVLGVALVRSTDRMLFRRRVNKPGIDVYLIGEELVEVDYSFTATGGELGITLAQKPAQSVSQVLVNDEEVGYEFVVDDELATAGSTSDTSGILLTDTLQPGDLVFVRYKFDGIPIAVTASFGGSRSLFETDILMRRAVAKNPSVIISAKASSTFNKFTLQRNLEEAIKEFFEIPTTGGVFLPSVLEDTLQAQVVGLGGRPVITLFQLADRGLLDIEPIELRQSEYAKVNLDLVEISID